MADPELAIWSAPVDDVSPLTRPSLVKLVLAYDGRQMAESAHGFVAVHDLYEDVTIEEVGRLVIAPAKRLVDAAVVAARVPGVNWETIGEVWRSPGCPRTPGMRRRRRRSRRCSTSPGRDRPPDEAWGQTLDRIGGGRGGAAASDQNADDLEQIADVFEREARVYQRLADITVPAQSVRIRSATHQDYATEAAKSPALAEKYRGGAAAMRADAPPPDLGGNGPAEPLDSMTFSASPVVPLT